MMAMQVVRERSFHHIYCSDTDMRLKCRGEKHVGSVKENQPDIMKGG